MERNLIADFSDTYGREPVIAVMPDGSLVCVIVTGGPTEPHNDNYVVICRSKDEGVTWTEPEVLFSHKSLGVWATEIFTGGEVPMMAVHTYNALNPSKELQTFVSYTYDNGQTWSSPVTMMPHCNGYCIRKGITLSNGDILFAVYFDSIKEGFGAFPEFGKPGFWSGIDHACGVLISSDGGKIFTPYGYFPGKLWEPNCVELEDGHILMYMRDSKQARINAAESFDYGRTWTHIGPIETYNADTKIALEKINGKVMMVSNVYDGMAFLDRKALQIRISDDLCKTWREPIYVDDPEKPFFYPHIAVDEKKRMVYVAYENARQHYVKRYQFEELGI